MDIEIAKSLTNGGRALDAVWDLPFTPHEKLFLLYLGAQLDFSTDQVKRHKYRRIEEVAEKIGIQEGTLQRVVDDLMRKKYIEPCEPMENLGKITTTSYKLGEKIWREYAKILHTRLGIAF